MLKPRRFDVVGRRAYLDDVRPRFLLLRVKADKVNISWGVPLWALEEVAAFALGAATLAQAVLPVLPATWRARMGAGIAINGRRIEFGQADTADAQPGAADERTVLTRFLRLMDDFAGGSLRDLLRVPPGEPYFEVSANGTRVLLVAH